MEIKTDTEALDMLQALKQYLSHGDPIGLKTPKNLEFSMNGGIRFNMQMLHYSNGTWLVGHLNHPMYCKCGLTLCERNDLKPGDVAFMTDENSPDFADLEDYYIILNSHGSVHWSSKGNVIVCNSNFNKIFRVEIKG